MGERHLILVPHLSTGGMPQYVLWEIKKLLRMKCQVFLVEFNDFSGPCYVVQKNKIKRILKEKHIMLVGSYKDKEKDLFSFINIISPDIIHLQEFPEMWLLDSTSDILYSKHRKYKIVETSHDSGFPPSNKKYFPDSFSFVSDFHVPLYRSLNIPYVISEYPIIYKQREDRDIGLRRIGLDPTYKHILNVGLFTPRKNQSEIFDIARCLDRYNILFHFVGNYAGNFRFYWEPLLKNKPKSCLIWGEQSNTKQFYSCMDLFLFTSRGTESDRETNPIVIKEALGWGMSILMYNLDVYNGKYSNNSLIKFLGKDININCEEVLKSIGIDDYSKIRRR